MRGNPATAYQRVGGFDLEHGGPYPLKVGGAGVRQLQPPRRAVEERRPDVGLEVGDRLRYRITRTSQPAPGGRETAGVGRANEGAQCIELIHRIVSSPETVCR